MRIIRILSSLLMFCFGIITLIQANIDYLALMLFFYGISALIMAFERKLEHKTKINFFDYFPLIGGVVAIIYVWIL